MSDLSGHSLRAFCVVEDRSLSVQVEEIRSLFNFATATPDKKSFVKLIISLGSPGSFGNPDKESRDS